jgi:enamine deaminase RidA (YjgF/YER057c/UK114 family)
MPRTDSRVATVTALGELWGYSRAVRVGDRIEVSGTAAWNDDGTVRAPGDAYSQTRAVFGIIECALAELGAGLRDVIRTRVFITHPEDFAEVARAHAEVFGAIRPASSCLGAAHLLHPDLRVEIEASAVMPE